MQLANLLLVVLDPIMLAAGASTTVAHGFHHKPLLVLPGKATAIKVLSVDDSTVTFQNDGTADEAAVKFFVVGGYPNAPDTGPPEVLWQGLGTNVGGTSGLGVVAAALVNGDGTIVAQQGFQAIDLGGGGLVTFQLTDAPGTGMTFVATGSAADGGVAVNQTDVDKFTVQPESLSAQVIQVMVVLVPLGTGGIVGGGGGG